VTTFEELAFTRLVATNVKRLRIERSLGVREVCEKSTRLSKGSQPLIARPITVPRWYRMEQGTHPRMVASAVDAFARVLGVRRDDLVTMKKPNRRKKKITRKKGIDRARTHKKTRPVN